MLYIFVIMAVIGIVAFWTTSRRTANRVSLLWTIATAIKHDMPLPDLIRAQARETWGLRRRLLLEMADTIREGTSLAEAVDRYRILLPEQGRLAIHVGSDTGTLNEALDAALELIERRPHETIRDYQSLVFYFCTVFVVAFGITAFIMVFIIPKFKDIFLGFGMELPELTLNVIAVADYFSGYFYVFPIALFLMIPLVTMITSLLTGGIELSDKYYLPQRLTFRFFGFSLLWWIMGPPMRFAVRFSPQRAIPEILRYLSVVAKADKPILPVVETLSKHHPAPDVRSRLRVINKQLGQGGSLWTGLERKGFLSMKKSALLHAAEISGNLPYALKEKSIQIEQEHSHRLICFAEYARVFVVLLFCLAVGILAVGLFAPLLKLINNLS